MPSYPRWLTRLDHLAERVQALLLDRGRLAKLIEFAGLGTLILFAFQFESHGQAEKRIWLLVLSIIFLWSGTVCRIQAVEFRLVKIESFLTELFHPVHGLVHREDGAKPEGSPPSDEPG